MVEINMRRKCPDCKSNGDVRIILRGLPKEEPDPDIYYVGGCAVSDEDADYICLNCDLEFYTYKKERLMRFIAPANSMKLIYRPKPNTWENY